MRGKTREDLDLIELLDPVADSVGYEIVRLRLMGGAEQRRLQIMAERPLLEDGTGGDMNVEDCAKLSRAISEVMDAADPIAGEYTLEVSSPGVDRPLTRLKDFDTYAGLEIRIELDRVAEGRKRFKGELAGVEDGQVGLNIEGEDDTTVYFPFDWIVEAKLVLTDQLMKRGAEQRAARVSAEGDDADQDDVGAEGDDSDIDLSESEED
ncbi:MULTISPECIES: ribosome maturation factor RimP [unclassified Caulobacter]|uniref:ribosome maturation factor RimP n=1 Tax=unclassified Caulobacter TaxID=2648921 RepID=UPI0004A6A90A|nr:ribosome maturation factor RimP [Caulobacter sp. UNC358MFTsu5.1]